MQDEEFLASMNQVQQFNEYIKDRNQNKVTTVRQLELIFD
jgi:hypothetical protein